MLGALLLFFVTAAAPPAAAEQCRAIDPRATDAWCELNCKHLPPYCPPDHCRCGPPPQLCCSGTAPGFEGKCEVCSDEKKCRLFPGDAACNRTCGNTGLVGDLACVEGVSVEEYCRRHPGALGCSPGQRSCYLGKNLGGAETRFEEPRCVGGGCRKHAHGDIILPSKRSGCRRCTCNDGSWECRSVRPELHNINAGTPRWGELLAYVIALKHYKNEGADSEGFVNNGLQQTMAHHSAWFTDVHFNSWFLPWHRSYTETHENHVIDTWLRIRDQDDVLRRWGWPQHDDGTLYKDEDYEHPAQGADEGLVSYIEDPAAICATLPFYDASQDSQVRPRDEPACSTGKCCEHDMGGLNRARAPFLACACPCGPPPPPPAPECCPRECPCGPDPTVPPAADCCPPFPPEGCACGPPPPPPSPQCCSGPPPPQGCPCGPPPPPSPACCPAECACGPDPAVPPSAECCPPFPPEGCPCAPFLDSMCCPPPSPPPLRAGECCQCGGICGEGPEPSPDVAGYGTGGCCACSPCTGGAEGGCNLDGNGCATTGFFKPGDKYYVPHFPPAAQQAGAGIGLNTPGHCSSMDDNCDGPLGMPTEGDVNFALFGGADDSEVCNYAAFRLRVEQSAVHNAPHNIVGGLMAEGASTNSHFFAMHHAWVDKVWADWQAHCKGRGFTSETCDSDAGYRENHGSFELNVPCPPACPPPRGGCLQCTENGLQVRLTSWGSATTERAGESVVSSTNEAPPHNKTVILTYPPASRLVYNDTEGSAPSWAPPGPAWAKGCNDVLLPHGDAPMYGTAATVATVLRSDLYQHTCTEARVDGELQRECRGVVYEDTTPGNTHPWHGLLSSILFPVQRLLKKGIRKIIPFLKIRRLLMCAANNTHPGAAVRNVLNALPVGHNAPSAEDKLMMLAEAWFTHRSSPAYPHRRLGADPLLQASVTAADSGVPFTANGQPRSNSTCVLPGGTACGVEDTIEQLTARYCHQHGTENWEQDDPLDKTPRQALRSQCEEVEAACRAHPQCNEYLTCREYTPKEGGCPNPACELAEEARPLFRDIVQYCTGVCPTGQGWLDTPQMCTNSGGLTHHARAPGQMSPYNKQMLLSRVFRGVARGSAVRWNAHAWEDLEELIPVSCEYACKYKTCPHHRKFGEFSPVRKSVGPAGGESGFPHALVAAVLGGIGLCSGIIGVVVYAVHARGRKVRGDDSTDTGAVPLCPHSPDGEACEKHTDHIDV